MAINKNTHKARNINFPIEIDEKVSKLAKENRRSLSAQVVYLVEQQLKIIEGKNNSDDNSKDNS